MNVRPNRRAATLWLIALTILLTLTPTIMAHTEPESQSTVPNAPPTLAPQSVLAYPPDPTADIDWSGGTSGVSDIQTAFNNARTAENAQLGTSLPAMTLPTQTEWDAMSDGQRALWLINRERIDRGVMPLHDIEVNVTSVAQYYADYLLDNDAWGHNKDGRSPWERLEDNPAIGACHDFLNVAENIAVFVTSGSSIALPIERSVFMWLYDDGSCCNWGHRHAILWYPYNDNSGPTGREGFLGIGRASGGPYQGPFSSPWPFAELIVMNVFDPCASWSYPSPPVPEITGITPASGMRGTSVHITDLAGKNFQSGATVTLTKTGETDIAATNVTVVSAARITCDIDLSTATTGSWNVTVRNPDGESATLSDGFTVTPPVPTMDGLPSQLLLTGETRDNAIDLWPYASDPYYATSELTFTIANSPDVNASVSLDSNRYIDIAPAAGWQGQTDVIVQVENPATQTDTDTFTVTVTDTLYNIYLPVVQRY